MRNFRRWLARKIMPSPTLGMEQYSTDSPTIEKKTSVDFNIDFVSNGAILTMLDWQAFHNNTKPLVHSHNQHMTRVVIPEGEELLPHIVALLAARRLK
jgi:hypothetical protein